MFFLLSELHFPYGDRLAEVMESSYDSVNRFLLREDYTPRDLFDEVMATFILAFIPNLKRLNSQFQLSVNA